MKAKEPAPRARPADLSNFSPMPRWNVPEMTVTCSTAGCQCGLIWKPSGSCRRMVNGPSCAGLLFQHGDLRPGGERRRAVHPLDVRRREEPVVGRVAHALTDGERGRRDGERRYQKYPFHNFRLLSVVPLRVRTWPL